MKTIGLVIGLVSGLVSGLVLHAPTRKRFESDGASNQTALKTKTAFEPPNAKLLLITALTPVWRKA